MNVVTISPSETLRWEAYVQSSPRTIAWHSYHWNRAVGSNYDADFHPLAAEEAGTICGILPLYRMRDPKAPLISVPFAVAGGMAADHEGAAEALLSAAIDLAGRLGASRLVLKQYRHPAPGPLRVDANYFNRELSLSTGMPAVWNQLDPRNRRAIETCQKDEVVLEYPSTNCDLFYDLLLDSLTRSGVPCPSRRWIHTLLDLNMYSIAMLRRNGRLIAATMVKTFKTTVSFPLTCLKGRGKLSYDASYVLYWRLIERFAAEGFQIFHSGRLPETEDVEPYRLGWGGDKHPYFYQYYPQTEAHTEYRTKRSWKRRVFVNGWKLMPNRLAEAMGPRIVARFP